MGSQSVSHSFVLFPLFETDSTAEHFRLFIGDLDPALSDDLFTAAFANARYPSFVKAKIIRDKYTNKGKGFGFVSYSDPQDFLKAWKEIDGASCHSLRIMQLETDSVASVGTYVGTRPVKISKATTGVAAVAIGNKKAHMLDAKTKAKTGTVPFEKAKAAIAATGGPNNGRSGNGGGFGPDKDRKSYIRR